MFPGKRGFGKVFKAERHVGLEVGGIMEGFVGGFSEVVDGAVECAVKEETAI